MLILDERIGIDSMLTIDYKHLEKNICDTIHEGQVKLGYAKECVRIYYFVASLESLLGVKVADEAEMDEILKEFQRQAKEELGNIDISHQGKRFCFAVPEQGVDYIYETYKENVFLKTLIEVLAKPDCQIEDIMKVFTAQSEHVVCEKMEAEFDYVIYYKEKELDEFRYCFSIGEMGAYYHRFTEDDYKSIME